MSIEKHKCYSDDRHCTVRAIEKAFGLTREEAYELCEKNGRQHRRGMTARAWRTMMNTPSNFPGYRVRELDSGEAAKYYGKTVRTAVRNMLPHETLIIDVSGHVATYCGGHTGDWMGQDGLQRIKHIYTVERK